MKNFKPQFEEDMRRKKLKDDPKEEGMREFILFQKNRCRTWSYSDKKHHYEMNDTVVPLDKLID